MKKSGLKMLSARQVVERNKGLVRDLHDLARDRGVDVSTVPDTLESLNAALRSTEHGGKRGKWIDYKTAGISVFYSEPKGLSGEPPSTDETPRTFVNLEIYLADPATKIRIAIAVKAALDAFSQRQKLGRGIATEEAAKVLTEIVLDALSPEADMLATATHDGGEA